MACAHYVARPASSNASNASGNKRSNASNDKKSSKKANTNGGMCTNCVKLNAGGESIPEYVMKNHSADTCRIKKKSSSDSNSSTSSAKAPKQSSLPFTSEQIGQIALVYQTLHTIGSANTGKKSKDASSEGSS